MVETIVRTVPSSSLVYSPCMDSPALEAKLDAVLLANRPHGGGYVEWVFGSLGVNNDAHIFAYISMSNKSYIC